LKGLHGSRSCVAGGVTYGLVRTSYGYYDKGKNCGPWPRCADEAGTSCERFREFARSVALGKHRFNHVAESPSDCSCSPAHDTARNGEAPSPHMGRKSCNELLRWPATAVSVHRSPEEPTIVMVASARVGRDLLSLMPKGRIPAVEYRVWIANQVDGAADGGNVDGWLVDLRIRDFDGVAGIRSIRARAPDAPLIAIGAGDAESATRTLAAGADTALRDGDPGDMVIETIAGFLRRVWLAYARDQLCIGDVVVDRRHQRVSCNGEWLHITLRQFRILECLAQNFGNVVKPVDLREYMWVYRGVTRPSVNSVEVQIAYLRRLLRESREIVIQTVPREGYVLIRNDQ